MPEKYFLINSSVEFSDKSVTDKISKERLDFNAMTWDVREKKVEEALHEDCRLKHVHGRVIVRVNVESKNQHRFANGMTIRRERAFNNLNFREVNPSNGYIISAENIPVGSEVLYDYTSLHDTNKIFGYASSSNDVQYFSFKEDEIYAWRNENNELSPMPNFEFALRVFKPYEGNLVGIQPTLLKDTLYVTTGDLKGKIVRTLRGCDYQIVFTGLDGKEDNLIRFRHSSDPDYDKEETICIADDLTELVNENKILVGLNANNAKTLKSIFEMKK